MSVAILIQVAELCWAVILGVVAVPPLLAIVTPDPCAKVVNPAPIDIIVRLLPIGYATEEFGGIVNAIADELLDVTMSPASANTNVYVVPVCALMS